MMIPPQLRPSFQAIRKPGKNGPAVFALYDPRPPLRDFTKNIDAKAKPFCLHKPTTGAHEQRGLRNRCLRSQPRRIGPGSAHWARPQHTELYAIMPVSNRIGASRIFLQAESSFLPNAIRDRYNNTGRPDWVRRGGYCRSTEFVIVVPRSSWRKIF